MFKQLNPHKTFLVLFLLFGLLMAFVTPPFQVPDEINHFYRAYQVSEGQFSSVKQDKRLGGEVPKSLITFSNEHQMYIQARYNRINLQSILASNEIQLNKDERIFKDFTNTALYPALLYLPQAMGISIGRFLNLKPLGLLYFGRLFNLLCFGLLVFFAVRIIPVKKWLLVLLTTLPMSVSLNSSLSADVLVNAISILTLSVLVNLAYANDTTKITRKHILILLILTVLLGFSKLVYLPIIFLVLLIPTSKFESIKSRVVILILVLGVGLGAAIVQKSIIDSKYIPYSEYNVEFRDYTMVREGVSINEQKEFIKEYPMYTSLIFFKSFFQQFKPVTSGYIGILGAGVIKLPKWFVWFGWIFIFLVTVLSFEKNNQFELRKSHRIYFSFTALVILSLIMLSQYLSWDLVGEGRVYPLQGRYIIPVVPVFLFSFVNIARYKKIFSFRQYITGTIVGFGFISGVLSLYLIVKNLYTQNTYKTLKWEINCVCESTSTDSNTIITDKKYHVLGSDTVAITELPDKKFCTYEKTFSSNMSLKLSQINPYAYTTYKKCKSGREVHNILYD